MHSLVFALRDIALNAFIRPFYAQTINHAIRMFMDALEDQNSEMGKHPNDFELYHLGDFDGEQGRHTNLASGPHRVASGAEKPQREPASSR